MERAICVNDYSGVIPTKNGQTQFSSVWTLYIALVFVLKVKYGIDFGLIKGDGFKVCGERMFKKVSLVSGFLVLTGLKIFHESL